MMPENRSRDAELTEYTYRKVKQVFLSKNPAKYASSPVSQIMWNPDHACFTQSALALRYALEGTNKKDITASGIAFNILDAKLFVWDPQLFQSTFALRPGENENFCVDSEDIGDKPLLWLSSQVIPSMHGTDKFFDILGMIVAPMKSAGCYTFSTLVLSETLKGFSGMMDNAFHAEINFGDSSPPPVAQGLAFLNSPYIPKEVRYTHVGKKHRKKGARGKRVRFISLRKMVSHDPSTSKGQAADRTYRYQWLVSGHFRKQPCGPGRTKRRLIFIPPYIKGPEGAPMIEKVYRVNR